MEAHFCHAKKQTKKLKEGRKYEIKVIIIALKQVKLSLKHKTETFKMFKSYTVS